MSGSIWNSLYGKLQELEDAYSTDDADDASLTSTPYSSGFHRGADYTQSSPDLTPDAEVIADYVDGDPYYRSAYFIPSVYSTYLPTDISYGDLLEDSASGAVDLTLNVNATPRFIIPESEGNISRALATNETSCASYLIRLSRWSYLYGVGFLIVVALLLNGLSFVVFRNKSLKKFAFSSYFAALSLVDMLALASHIPRKWLNDLYDLLAWGEGITFYDSSTIACKAITYFAYIFRFLSSWLIVALVAERMVVSSNPYRASKVRTAKAARRALFYSTVSALVINAHVVFIWQSVKVDNRYSCVPISPSDFISIILTLATVLSIVGLPFLIVSVLTTLTIKNLRAWKMRQRRMSANALCRALLERQATVMVCTVAIVFSLLCLPYAISWTIIILQHFSPTVTLCQYLEIAAVRDMMEILFMLNYSIKFLLCIFTGKNILNRR